MPKPDYHHLSMLKQGGWYFDATFMHPNPRFYKYRWQIYWRKSPRVGSDFVKMNPLSTKQAFELMDWLDSNHEPHLITNTRFRRQGIAIWDLNSPRLADERWASAYDDDPDPIHSSGHR